MLTLLVRQIIHKDCRIDVIKMSYQSDERRCSNSVQNLSKNEEIFVDGESLWNVVQRRIEDVTCGSVTLQTKVRRDAGRVKHDGVRSQIRSCDEMRQTEKKRTEAHHDKASAYVLGLRGPDKPSEICDRYNCDHRADIVTSGNNSRHRWGQVKASLYGWDDSVDETVDDHALREQTSQVLPTYVTKGVLNN